MVNLKGTYFYIKLAPHHRRFPMFVFKGVAYQFKVLPFMLALATQMFTKCVNADQYRQSGQTES